MTKVFPALNLEETSISYDEFCNFVTTDPKMLYVLFSSRGMSAPETDKLAHYLVKIANTLGTTATLFNELLKLEFEKTASSQSRVILRANTLATKSMDQFLQITNSDFISNTVSDVVQKLIGNEELDLELDPTKLPEGDKEKLSQEHLQLLNEHTKIFVEKIFSNSTIEAIPLEVRIVSRCTKDLAETYGWDSPPLIGSFIMLRLFNPAIVFPETRKVVSPSTTISTKQRRNLILVSKVLQNLSNGVLFGAKEAFMTPMNEFVEKYQQTCNQFFLDVCINDQTLNEYKQKQVENVLHALNTKAVTKNNLEDVQAIHELFMRYESKFQEMLDSSFVGLESGKQFLQLMSKLPKLEIKTPPPSSTTTTTTTTTTATEKPVDPKYLALLQKADKVDMAYFDALHMLTIKGKTKEGLPIVMFVEEKLRKDDADQALLYIIKKLDKFVEQDYAMIWCINNTAGAQRPSLQWMLNTYRSIDYKYKKNLKSFFLIHPSFLYKLIINFFKPFVSEKFWKKLHLCDSLSKMYTLIDKDQIAMPMSVLNHDLMTTKASPPYTVNIFRTPLAEVMNRGDCQGKSIPPCIEAALQVIETKGLHVEGIFRLSGNQGDVQKLSMLMDNGDNVDLYAIDVNMVSNVIKLFLRELPDPVFPFGFYDKMIQIGKSLNQKTEAQTEIISSSLSHHAAIDPLLKILHELPKHHYELAKRIFKLLNKIQQYAGENRMTSGNLAVCMGPNLIRLKTDNPSAALKDTAFIVKVTDLMIQEYQMLFESKMNVTTKHRQRSVARHSFKSNTIPQEVQELEKQANLQKQHDVVELKASNRKKALLSSLPQIKGDYFDTKEPTEEELLKSIKAFKSSDTKPTTTSLDQKIIEKPVVYDSTSETTPAESGDLSEDDILKRIAALEEDFQKTSE